MRSLCDGMPKDELDRSEDKRAEPSPKREAWSGVIHGSEKAAEVYSMRRQSIIASMPRRTLRTRGAHA